MLKFCTVALVVLPAASQARLVRIEIAERSAAQGYEQIIGKAHFAVDPRIEANRRIADIGLAPRNSGGQVEFSADFHLMRPSGPPRRNGTVLFEPPNRGRKNAIGLFNRTSAKPYPQTDSDFGDNFLLSRGFTIVWLGWQPDLVPGAYVPRLYAPVLADVAGLVRTDYVPSAPETSFPIADPGHLAYPTLEHGHRRLTVRHSHDGPRLLLPESQWRIEQGRVVVPAGLQPGKIYELVYSAKSPTVAGLGLAAVRDFIAYLKYGDGRLLPQVDRFTRAIGFGVSQSGMFLRTFLYEGFNADENGRQVFDALFSHVAGGRRVSLNQRLAQPSRTAGPFRAFFSPTDIFPFADASSIDPVSGENDGLGVRASKAGVSPKIFYTNSSYEYWGCSASLTHTTADGTKDLPLPANVRMYVFAGGQHGPSGFPPGRPGTLHLANPNDYRWSLRALLVALQEWVEEGREPPPSRYPTIQSGELVPLSAVAFPAIPGVRLPYRTHESFRLDYGPGWRRGILEREPPHVGKPYGVLVPQVDPDGIDLGGIRLPEVAVPLATYTGWNPRAPASGAPRELANSMGAWIPFPRDAAEREHTGDSRLSIRERYPSRRDYLQKVQAAAEKLAASRYLLNQDVPLVVERGEVLWHFLHDSMETGKIFQRRFWQPQGARRDLVPAETEPRGDMTSSN